MFRTITCTRPELYMDNLWIPNVFECKYLGAII